MPKRLFTDNEQRIHDLIDEIRNDDGACVRDAQEVLNRIAEYAKQCSDELHCEEPEKNEVSTV